jgi:zinc transporter 1
MFLTLSGLFSSSQKSAETRTERMTYGWKRTEILGAVMNGCFLLALCLYIVLEAIPRFINPTKTSGDWWFIGTAGAGLVVNLIGTVIFAG